MSLENPTWIERAIQHKRWLIYGGLGLLLVLVALFLYQCGDDYLFKSKVQKQKDEIANSVDEIRDISNQIANLQEQKAGKVAEINAATEQLEKDIFGREEVKAEVNQALANFQRAINSNSNVNRTAEDIEKILEKLEE
jgi:biopolymer transport protein ExbB/TolQ